MGQQRIVKHEAPVGADVGEQEQHQGKEPPALWDEEHERDRRHPHREKGPEQSLLDRHMIGNGPEDR